MFHSLKPIESEKVTITMLEFIHNLDQANPPNTDPTDSEASYFKQNILPEIINLKSTKAFRYTRHGTSLIVALSATFADLYTQETDPKAEKKRIITSIVGLCFDYQNFSGGIINAVSLVIK